MPTCFVSRAFGASASRLRSVALVLLFLAAHGDVSPASGLGSAAQTSPLAGFSTGAEDEARLRRSGGFAALKAPTFDPRATPSGPRPEWRGTRSPVREPWVRTEQPNPMALLMSGAQRSYPRSLIRLLARSHLGGPGGRGAGGSGSGPSMAGLPGGAMVRNYGGTFTPQTSLPSLFHRWVC
jgi:hypothetical protein